MSFVDEGPAIRELYKTDKSERIPIEERSRSSSANSSRSRPVNAAPFEYLSRGVSHGSGASPVLENSGRSPDLERSTLVSILSPTAHQSQLFAMFFGTIRSDNPVKIAPTFSCHSVWLAQVASQTQVSSTLTYAIRAISLSFLGRKARDQNLVQTARLIYGKTLLKLNKSLQDPVEGLASDTLSATILLTFYEMLNCTEHDSWVRHAGGAAHLMKLRGVARHQTGFDRALFLSCRFSMVMESYQTGKPCFLSSAPWRELSQQIHNSSPRTAVEDAREAFFQEIVHHPGYVMDSVEYMASGGRDPSVLQDLVRRGHKHRSNHKAIYNQFIAALRKEGQEPTEVPSAVNDRVFPIVYQFPGILVASHFCSYWSLLKLLNVTLIGLEAKLSNIESARQGPQEQVTPAQILAARNMVVTRENLTDVVVAESTTSQDVENVAGPSNTRGGASRSLPDRTSASPAARSVASRSPGSPVSEANSPTDYPTMSSSDTAKRRQMYMAENKRSAHEICKSVEHVSTSAFLGPVFLISALKVIGRMLDSPEEKEWIERKMEEMGRTWGFAKFGARQSILVPGLQGRLRGKAVDLSPRARDDPASFGEAPK